jgi:murein DD-endopeptidase MepM/ murein hydrolase activator NlpD
VRPYLDTARTLSLPVILTACFSSTTTGLAPDGVGCDGASYPNWETSPYVLPYPVGIAHRIDLSNCSGSFHSAGEPDEFATDFAMTIGTVITASRDGTVVQVEESGIDGGFPNNLVVVDHGDGTFAQYMHLTEDGALVEIGDAVARGDTLGLSGATGLAGYPHLHFVVTQDDWPYPYASIPVTFSNTDANPHGLRSGGVYEAGTY